MKQKLMGTIVILALVVVAAFSSCSQPADPLSSSAALSSISVGGVQAESIGTPGRTWNSAVPGFVWLDSTAMTGAKVSVGKNGEAVVYYQKVDSANTGSVIPDFQADAEFNFVHGDSLYIRVFSENHDAESFYQIIVLAAEAKLTSITIAGVSAQAGVPNIQPAIAAAGAVYLSKSQLASAAVTAAAGTGSPAVKYINVLPGVVPAGADYGTSALNLAAEEIVFIEVKSGSTAVYYKVAVYCTTPEITDITLAGRSATGGEQLNGMPIPQFGTGVGTPGASWDAAGIVAGEVWFGATQAGSAQTLTVSPLVDGTTFTVGVGSGSAQPSFSLPNPLKITPVNGQFLYIKAVGPYPAYPEPVYYKIALVSKSDDLSLSSVTMQGSADSSPTTVAVGQMGTHSFPGSEAWGNYSNGAELAAGETGYYSTTNKANLSAVTIVVTPTDSGATIKYGSTPRNNERNYIISFGASNVLNLTSGDFVALEVSSEIGEKGWYKFRVRGGSSDASLESATVTVSSLTATIGELTVIPGSWGDTITGTPGSVTFSATELAAAAQVAVTGAPAGSTLSYGMQGAGFFGPAAPAVWNTDGNMGVQAEGSTIWIRVAADDEMTVKYYAVTIQSNTPPSVTALQIGGYPGYGTVVAVTNLGTPNAALASVTAGAVTLTTAQATTETMTATPELGPNVAATGSGGTTVRYAKTTGADPVSADWKEAVSGVFGLTYPQFIFANGDVLWLEAVKGGDTLYYKIAVTVAN